MPSPLRLGYLALAGLGAVLPMGQFLPYLSAHGWNPLSLVAGWTANPAALGLSYDLVISALALTLWILAETRVRRNWSALWAIPATFFIGVACGLPLYLFLRTRKVI